jgi:hypothetical protein
VGDAGLGCSHADDLDLSQEKRDERTLSGSTTIIASRGLAQKGVFITISAFTKAAQNAAKQTGPARIVLINGEFFTNLMVRFNMGVRTRAPSKSSAQKSNTSRKCRLSS